MKIHFTGLLAGAALLLAVPAISQTMPPGEPAPQPQPETTAPGPQQPPQHPTGEQPKPEEKPEPEAPKA